MTGGLITNEGKKIMLDRTYNNSPTRNEPVNFKVGIGTVSAVVADTDLGHAIPINATDEVDDCDTADWNDSADMTTTVNTSTFKEGTGSLNLIKDGTASATASTSKTTTSVDFTSKELSVWFYVVDAAALAKLATSSCVNIRLGSDSSNYYEWNKDNADLTAGSWNLLDGLTSANADSTTGSPVLAAMDYSFVSLVGTGSAIVWVAGDFMMDDWKVVETSDYLRSFESGYPLLDYTNLSVSLRCRVPTTVGNGYPISEFGIFNDDGSPLLESRDVFSAISKSVSDELIFIVKNTIE